MTHLETIRRGIAAKLSRLGARVSWRSVRVRAVRERGRPGWWVLRSEVHLHPPRWALVGPLGLARRSRGRLLADAARWAERRMMAPR